MAAMNVSELVLEERYAGYRDSIFRLLSMTSDFVIEVANMFVEVFAPVEMSEHGPILWSVMAKTQGIKTGVLGLHFKAYLQYYYLYLVSASQRAAPNRPLDLTAQAFLVCTAAFGYTRGVGEFDKAFFAQDAAMIDNTIIDKTYFLNFFDATDDQFSFMHMWRIIDRLWEAWDCTSPILVHGFVTPTMSEKMLALRSIKPGSFLMRFSSRGGLAVDYLRNGKLEKAHWKFSVLADINALRALLWDPVQWGPNLQFLVDTTLDSGFNANVVEKAVCFPTIQSYEDDTHMDSDGPVVRTSYNMIH
jgi:hypothetical protein